MELRAFIGRAFIGKNSACLSKVKSPPEALELQRLSPIEVFSAKVERQFVSCTYNIHDRPQRPRLHCQPHRPTNRLKPREREVNSVELKGRLRGVMILIPEAFTYPFVNLMLSIFQAASLPEGE